MFAFFTRLVKRLLLGCFFPYVYTKAANRAFDPWTVLFIEIKETALPDSFKVMYTYLTENSGFNVEFISLEKTHVSTVAYLKNCYHMIQRLAVSKYAFINDASDVISCVPLRLETKVVQLWHACGAFKKWGMSTADLRFGGTEEEIRRHPFYKNLSLVTVSSPQVVWAYVEAMALEQQREIVKPTGVSRTDIFFQDSFPEVSRRAVEGLFPQCKGRKILLYAPTFRGRTASAEGPDALSVIDFRDKFEKDYFLLIKHHPFVKNPPKIPERCTDFAALAGDQISIDMLLGAADVCITDYSSIIFEYSLFLKPMIFFAYDFEDYCDWRGFYYDYEELTPGPVFSNNDDMINYLRDIDKRFDRQEVIDFRDKFMSACDGHSTERICKEVFGETLHEAKGSANQRSESNL